MPSTTTQITAIITMLFFFGLGLYALFKILNSDYMGRMRGGSNG